MVDMKAAILTLVAISACGESVPELASLLTDAATVEKARSALEQIPDRAATDALRLGLTKAPEAARAGIVVSLGRRGDPSAVPSIAPLLKTPLADVAATALGYIGGAAARDALLTAKPSPAVSDALLAIAEKTRSSGLYRKLASADNPDSVRAAALRGLARLEPKQTLSLLAEALRSNSPRLQAVAIRELAAIEGAALAKRVAGFSPRARVQALAALADTGKQDIVPVLEQSLDSEDMSVRIAALKGIARLGGADVVPKLAAKAALTTGDEQTAARDALGSIPGKGVDAAVLNTIESADPKTKVELIRAAGERGIASAPEVLLKTASDASQAVRTESIRALRETAGGAQVSALLALLVETGDDRTDYERAVAAAIRRSRDASVDQLTKAYRATTDSDLQSSLLGVMAAVGNNESLPVIREALASSEADVQRAAINALASWPAADPANDLLAIAQNATNASRQVLALRGYVRLVQIPSDRPAAETVRMLAAAMSAARRADEKRLVIAAAQRVIAPESLELIRTSAADTAVAAEAKAAIATLERSLAYSGRSK